MARSTQEKEERKVALGLGDPEQAYQLPDLSFNDGFPLSDEEQEEWDKNRDEEQASRDAAAEHEDKVGRDRADKALKAAEAEAKKTEKAETKAATTTSS